MEQFDLPNSIPGGDAQQLLSDTIVKAASSAALAAVRSVLSDKSKKKKVGGTLKFSNRELNSMSDKLKNYFVCKDRLVSYRFHKGVYEVQFRRDGIKLYVAAKDLDTLKARFRYEMEQYLLLHPDCPRPPKSRYNLPNFSFQPQSQIPVPATSPSPQQEALQSVLFTDYVAQWLTLKKQTVKPRTYQEYERMSKCHFQKDFAGVPLKDMTRTKIQEYLFRFVDEGKFRTAEKLHLAFSCILDLAADDLGFVSPMKKIVLPYHESKKGNALTKAEEKTLVEFCISHKNNAASSALLVMLYCGLRRSELKSIRTEENFLICTTSKQRQGRVEVERKIPFSPMLRKVLPYVDFEKAKSVNLSTIQTTFKRLFPEHHPHELRYTFITRAKEAGCNLEAVMLWAGHSFDKDVKTSAVDRGYTDYSDEYLYNEAQKIHYEL